MTGGKGNYGTKNVERMAPLKYLSIFEELLINCETNLFLTC